MYGCNCVGHQVAGQLAGVLLQLAFEAQESGGSLQPFLAGLRRLASEQPTLLTPLVPFLGSFVTLAGTIRTIRTCRALHVMMH